MIINRRPGDLEAIAAYLTAQGVPVPTGLGARPLVGGTTWDLFTYDAQGRPVDLPAAAAAALAGYTPTRPKRPTEYVADFQTAAQALQDARQALGTAQAAYTAASTALARENALRDGLVAVNSKVDAVGDQILALGKAVALLAGDRLPDTD